MEIYFVNTSKVIVWSYYYYYSFCYKIGIKTCSFLYVIKCVSTFKDLDIANVVWKRLQLG